MDHYPYFFNEDPTSNTSTEGYHRNMQVLRKYSLLKGIPFWNFFNAIPFNTHLAPNKGQLAWQAFTSLSYGAKGVLYFTYWSPGFPPSNGGAPKSRYHRSMDVLLKREGETTDTTATATATTVQFGDFDKGGGLVSPMTYGIDGPLSAFNYAPTLQYQYAKEINTLLLNFGTYLLDCNSTGVWRPHLGAAPARSPIVGLNETNSAGSTPGKFMPSGNYLIGFFERGAGGKNAILIMNQRYDIDLWPTITLRSGFVGKMMQEVDEVSGRVRPVRDDSPGIPGLQMVLPAGHARLLVVV